LRLIVVAYMLCSINATLGKARIAA